MFLKDLPAWDNKWTLDRPFFFSCNVSPPAIDSSESVHLKCETCLDILTILGSIVNIIGGTVWLFKKKDNLYFDNEYYKSSKNDKEHGYSLDLDLKISYKSRV